jgi:uncharacterized protein
MGIYKNLSDSLFNKTRQSVLALLYGHPNEPLYLNQILRSLNIGSGTVQRELKTLAEAGIILRTRTGNQVYYQANNKSPIFNELRGLILKIQGEGQPSVDSRFNISSRRLSNFCRRNHIKKLSLFGSVLRDDFRPDSDIDILVEFEAGHVPGFGIVNMEKELSSLLGRNVDLRTPSDLSRYFREQVVREAKVEYEHS